MTIFVQAPPQLGNQYRDDPFLRSYLQRKLPARRCSDDRAGPGRSWAQIAAASCISCSSRIALNEPTLGAVGRLGQSHRSHRSDAAVATRRADRGAARV